MERQEIADSINTIEQAIQEARKVPSGAYFYDILWGSIFHTLNCLENQNGWR